MERNKGGKKKGKELSKAVSEFANEKKHNKTNICQ
jgi:hypothetical protein